MATLKKISKLNYAESLDVENALAHIIARFKKHSRPVVESDYRVLYRVVLSPAEVAALSKLHDIFYSKVYGED